MVPPAGFEPANLPPESAVLGIFLGSLGNEKITAGTARYHSAKVAFFLRDGKLDDQGRCGGREGLVEKWSEWEWWRFYAGFGGL